jgi:hypothetical protein
MLRRTAPWLLLLGFAATPFLGGCDADNHDHHRDDRQAWQSRNYESRDSQAVDARYHDREDYHHD